VINSTIYTEPGLECLGYSAALLKEDERVSLSIGATGRLPNTPIAIVHLRKLDLSVVFGPRDRPRVEAMGRKSLSKLYRFGVVAAFTALAKDPPRLMAYLDNLRKEARAEGVAELREKFNTLLRGY
jgi:hypothetical protein